MYIYILYTQYNMLCIVMLYSHPTGPTIYRIFQLVPQVSDQLVSHQSLSWIIAVG